MRLLSVTLLSLLISISACADGHLIVFVSIDQLRQDYLNRFQEDLTAGGFAMFRTCGAIFPNARYDYASTETGPGHATMATGAYGMSHGIVGNDWYDRRSGRGVYCVEDSTVSLLGAPGEGRSPHLLIGSTIGDELRIGSGFLSKVIAVSWKDRAAILMGGKLANGAFWVVDSTVVSSSYYMQDLPEWVRRFNASGQINACFGAEWDRALPLDRYTGLEPDDAPFEKPVSGLGRTFPHPIDGGNPEKITPSFYAALRTSPFANMLTVALAVEALHAEGLGKRGVTDLLAISLSANDYLGHAYGPNSHEVFDLVVRTDSLLARFWKELDAAVGLAHCTIVLTADHGVAPVPEFLTSHVPGSGARRVNPREFQHRLLERLASRRPSVTGSADWIERTEGNEIYLDASAVAASGITREEAAQIVADELRSFDEVFAVYTAGDLLHCPATSPIERRLRHSFFPGRSGDIFVVLKPFVLPSSSSSGTSHGSPYPYDAHVPLLMAGPRVRPGTYERAASPADIAPTLAVMLGIERPAQATGTVLQEAILPRAQGAPR